MANYIIGIDVGGTNIKLGLINTKGKIIDRTRLNTKTFVHHKRKLMMAIVDSIRALIQKNQLTRKKISAIGIGLPGAVDSFKGIVKSLPNIPHWKNVPLRKYIQKRLSIPVFMDNDVNLITLGEWKFGAGRGYKNLICFTLGTGVGGGLILNGALYRGERFVAGEIGHMPLNEIGPKCPCGGYGCFERYVGNARLQQQAQKIFRDSTLRLEDVFAAAERGDKRAIQFWETTARHIGNALIGIVNLLNPKLIIVGGGVSNNFKFMGRAIKQVIQARAMKIQAQHVRVVRAKLGDDAGLLGAYALIKEFTIER